MGASLGASKKRRNLVGIFVMQREGDRKAGRVALLKGKKMNRNGGNDGRDMQHFKVLRYVQGS